MTNGPTRTASARLMAGLVACLRRGSAMLAPLAVALLMALPGHAAPYAGMVIDARTGEIYYAENADARLHPASLTKMMTLYVVFQAVEAGEISLDTMVTVSKHAASRPPSKLGLRPGSQIALRHLIRAAAVKSANDAATALGEAISGSEEAFAQRMTATAQSIGMTRSTFRNAHGLTQEGHLSTARDMTLLGRRLFYDFPAYYNLFGRKETDAGLKHVQSTNHRFLSAYKGADGIKTGYTVAAGFNLVASAERGHVRIIATVFGGRSTASRNAKVAELLDLGFARAPAEAPVRRPDPVAPVLMASAGTVTVAGGGAGIMTSTGAAPARSPRPAGRPAAEVPPELLAVIAQSVGSAQGRATGALAGIEPQPRPGDAALEVVTRVSTSGERLWGVNVGHMNSRYEAERLLLRTALSEMAALDGSLRKVVPARGGFDANFVAMTRDGAARACERLVARGAPCRTLGPT